MPEQPNEMPTVLLVEDEPTQRRLISSQLKTMNYHVVTAEDGVVGIKTWQDNPQIRIVITDLRMPNMDGFGVLKKLRESEHHYTYVIVLTASGDKESMYKALSIGADDYILKPVVRRELELRLKGAERLLKLEGQNGLIFALAKLAAVRSGETGSHLWRVREYCSIIGRDLLENAPELNLSSGLVQDIANVSPLHDIGKVGVSDAILHKPGRLTPEEFEIMKTHTIIGGDLLAELLAINKSNYIKLAHNVTLYHHERWDGSGYPQGLKGTEIPIAARIMALADVYDALTTTRCYKPKFPYPEAERIIIEENGKHFDPAIVESFLRCKGHMAKIRYTIDEE